MPRLAICSRDLHWHWINRTLLCDTMEVSMLSRAWLTIAQHVFQPALTGRPELISRKIVSGEPGTKAIAVSRFREKLSPANWVQGVTAISRKISRSWAPKKWGPTCDRDISNSAIYTTAIYRAYTVSCYQSAWVTWLTHWGLNKMAYILQTTFLKCIFLNEKHYCDENFTEFHSKGSSLQ